MDLLSLDSRPIRGIARPDIVGVEDRFHATAWKKVSENSSKTLSDIQLSDVKLLTF